MTARSMLKTSVRLLPVLLLALSCACGTERERSLPRDSGPAVDANGDSGAQADAGGAMDAALRDQGFDDSGPPDSGWGQPDAGELDAGFEDAGFEDAGFEDAGFADTGSVEPDAGPPDATPGDGGAADGGAADASVACTIDGYYDATIAGNALVFLFSLGNGTWMAAPSRSDLPFNPQGTGLYSYGNFVLTISDTMVGCPPSQVGTYDVSFTPACDAFTVARVSDPCLQRGNALNGTTFTR